MNEIRMFRCDDGKFICQIMLDDGPVTGVGVTPKKAEVAALLILNHLSNRARWIEYVKQDVDTFGEWLDRLYVAYRLAHRSGLKADGNSVSDYAEYYRLGYTAWQAVQEELTL